MATAIGKDATECNGKPAEFNVPQTLTGHRTYEMKRRLGAGMCGIVYEYMDTTNGKSVAVKFPFSEFAAGERVAFSISQKMNPNRTYQNHLSPAYEMVELSILQHGMAAIRSGVAVVWGWGGERTLYEDLVSRAKAKKSLPEATARLYLEHMMAGLRRLHSAGYIHGDCHMDNVMVHIDRSGKHLVNLIDFGLCRPTGKRWGDVYGGAKPFAKGHVQHPPELWTGSVHLEAASRRVPGQEMRINASHDVWSAGAIFFQLLNGDIKQLETTMVARIEASAGGTAGARQALEQACAGFKEADATLLKACLEPDPSRRASAAEILTRLQNLREGEK